MEQSGVKPLLLSIRSYDYMRALLTAKGDFEEAEVERRLFADGELYQRQLVDPADRDVILVGGTVNETDTLELYDLACSITKHGARSLCLVVPYFGYSTMERAVKPLEVVTAKTRARLLSAIPAAGGGNRVLLMDLHVSGLAHYFEGSIRPQHIYAKPVILQAARELGGDDFVFACTDAGRAKWVESLANDLGVTAAFVFKRRLDGDRVELTGVSAEVQGRSVVIYDDMVRTGGSLLQAARAYHQAGASRVSALTTHGLLPGDALEKLKESGLLNRLVATDTHPRVLELAQDDFFSVRGIAELLRQAILSP